MNGSQIPSQDIHTEIKKQLLVTGMFIYAEQQKELFSSVQNLYLKGKYSALFSIVQGLYRQNNN